MKMIGAVLVSLIGFSANASTSVEQYGQYNNQYDNPYENATNKETTALVSNSDRSYNTIRFSGRVSEGTCVNTATHTQCGADGATVPLRVERNYSFGTIVTLTYL